MMLDTLAIARDLRAADMAPAQAEAIASAIGKSISESTASKADIQTILQKMDGMEARLSGDIKLLEQRFVGLGEAEELSRNALEDRLISKLESLRSSMLTWVVTVLIAGAGLIVAIGRLT